jgi:2-dehydro-3-deoxyphosphooctonate aldolase (KDO 8-P synthase)
MSKATSRPPAAARRTVSVGGVRIGRGQPLGLIAGPCVIESRASCLALAARLATLARERRMPLVFKASYDKANRTSVESYRGPGIERGLAILAEVRERYGLPVLTDVHTVDEARRAARVVDVLQIPAFLCRQTDLLLAAGESGRPVNIKKGQFVAPWDMVYAVRKVLSTGNRDVILTERGASFGYNNLVADMRSLLVLRETGCPVVFDATHSVQRPGAAGGASGGDSRWVPALARAAVAAGCDAVFMEVHPQPRRALSDGANALPLRELGGLWDVLRRIHALAD